MTEPPLDAHGRSHLIGKTLSHYRITAAIGVGGTGEVYRLLSGALRPYFA